MLVLLVIALRFVNPTHSWPGSRKNPSREVGAAAGMPGGHPDVVVLGEVLVRAASSLEALADGASLRLGFSGDALNAAAAAAAAGAHTALVARVPDDELGDQLVARVADLGVDTTWSCARRGSECSTSPMPTRTASGQFTYVRRGSAGAGLGAGDLDDQLLSRLGVVVASGVACAVSDTLAAAVVHAAETASRFVYDPNFRPRLTTPAQAAATLRRLAPLAEVITPSWPDETRRLLDLAPDTSARDALAALAGLGARGVGLTLGLQGALVAAAGQVHEVPGVPAPVVVDQTGAGDCLTGHPRCPLGAGRQPDRCRPPGSQRCCTVGAGGQGGTGYVPTLSESVNPWPHAGPQRS